jgi:hypothetical protein
MLKRKVLCLLCVFANHLKRLSALPTASSTAVARYVCFTTAVLESSKHGYSFRHAIG